MKSRGIAISMVYPIMKTLVHKGYEAELFCRAASFDYSLLQDVEARIDGKELERLMLEAAAYTNDDYFGLSQGGMMEFADMGVLGYVMLHSKTISDALSAYRRYNDILCSGINLDWDVRGDEASIRLFTQHEGSLSRHCVEDMAHSLYRLMAKLGNRPISLRAVHFAHDAPADVEPYVRTFGVVPRFGERSTRLLLDKDALNHPVLYADSKLLALFETIVQDTLSGWEREGAYAERVVEWFRTCMPAYFPTLRQTADSFGTSTRTLQNKLKEENTSYVELTTRVRKELAIGYLKKREFSVGDIAYALHFSEPSAFQSAFKKWTGQTPGQYRAYARTEASIR
ncbi:AraC family transcriptional regulator [Cohnella suwonensis]|uniref:AraC family transcriptional regulator n=1 Tax=Cohnella suwonensis TaxID=696072 RepID=A0ABW0M2L3_9BACL